MLRRKRRRRRRKVYSGANAVNEEDPERDRATRTRSQIACCVKRASSRHHLGFAKSHNFSTSWGDASSRHHLCVTLLSTSVTATRPAGSTVMRPGLRKRAAAPVPSSKLPPASRCLPAHALGASLARTTPGDAVGWPLARFTSTRPAGQLSRAHPVSRAPSSLPLLPRSYEQS